MRGLFHGPGGPYQEIKVAFARHGVRYVFIGKSGAVLLGYPDTTQDAALFVEKSEENGARCAASMRDLGFDISVEAEAEIRRGKDFVQLKNGPFDLDLVFAPDGIESFGAASRNRVETEGFHPHRHREGADVPASSAPAWPWATEAIPTRDCFGPCQNDGSLAMTEMA